MKVLVILLVPIIVSSCASVNENNNYGFMIGPGMSEDAQDFPDTKYNLMDSTDGKQDPNASVKAWKAEF